MVHLGVFFGSNTVEHEISVITAIQAIDHLKQLPNYKIVPIYVSKEGNTYTGDALFEMDHYKDLEALKKLLTPVTLTKGNHVIQLLKMPIKNFQQPVVDDIHVAFPIFHGSFGEDGTFQGLFELMDIPYVGCDVLAAATTMDKITSKLILKESGIPVVDYYWLNANQWVDSPNRHMEAIEGKFTYPVIVKPANTGSSIGVSVAHNRDELEDAINLVRKFSNRILIEYMVKDIMEVNISVLGDCEQATVSVIERPITDDEFLTFEDKYESNSKTEGMSSAKRQIPAILPDGMKEAIEEIALDAFRILDCSGVSRLDFMIEQTTGHIYLNEFNTIPGSLSFYIWEPTGVPYTELLERLIQLAYSKHRRKKKLVFSNRTNILSGVDLKGIKK